MKLQNGMASISQPFSAFLLNNKIHKKCQYKKVLSDLQGNQSDDTLKSVKKDTEISGTLEIVIKNCI